MMNKFYMYLSFDNVPYKQNKKMSKALDQIREIRRLCKQGH